MAGEEAEVRREDQDKINKFSRLHQREQNLEDELKTKQVRRHCFVAYEHTLILVTERQGGS